MWYMEAVMTMVVYSSSDDDGGNMAAVMTMVVYGSGDDDGAATA